jgi:hypothetical protein
MIEGNNTIIRPNNCIIALKLLLIFPEWQKGVHNQEVNMTKK